MAPPIVPLEVRFWRFVPAGRDANECWEWTGQRGPDGYGLLSLTGGKRRVTATRIALQIDLGRPLGPHEDACHRCDNPPCVNPAHLFAGSRRANVRDSIAKGRAKPRPPQPGQSNPLSRFSDEQAETIRRRYAAGGISQRQLAREFGTTQSTIWAIVSGRSYRAAPPVLPRVPRGTSEGHL